MTLTQWVNSTYNTDNFIVENDVVYNEDKSKKISGKNGSSKIEKDGSYTLTRVSSGGGPVLHSGGSND